MIEEIKEKIDLVDFLRNYLQLSPAGKNFKALCPFHKEKTPSFVVSPDRRIWHCFGCSQGGDVIKFLMLYENLEFFEALRILAEKAGVAIQKTAGVDQRRYNVLYALNESAKDFFQSRLNPEVGNYLQERGLNKETIKEFEIGFAPVGPDSLTKHLLTAGQPIASVEDAGLTLKTERGNYWDRFRGRIMFPIFNAFGKTVGFTGRILPELENDKTPKYLNSPETPIFNKSRLLFGIHKSKNAIRESRIAVLAEGQMDFLMLWQDGVKNAVATSGTALTIDHLKILRRLADGLIVSLDNDEAGQAATERAIDLAEANDFVIKVAKFGEKDPADFVKNHPGKIKSALETALSAVAYYLDKYPVSGKDRKLSLGEIKKNLRIVLGKIKNVSSSVERGQWLKELEKRSGIGENLLLEEMEALKTGVTREEIESEVVADQVLSRQERIADQLLNLAFSKKEFFEELSRHADFLPEAHRQTLLAEAKDLNDIILLRSSLSLIEKDESKAARQFKELLRQLQLEYWKIKRKIKMEEMNQAKDEKIYQQLLEEFNNISSTIQSLGISPIDLRN